jgi:hypothetical protein
MADIGAEDGVELRAERKLARIECHGVDRIVGLAAEVKVGHEQVADILRPFDATSRPVVERGRVLIGAADAQPSPWPSSLSVTSLPP